MASLSFLGSLRFPYPDYGHGIWGEQTSTLNFCEEDYAMSYYCAEVCNTVTNALFLWLGIKGIRNCIQQGHDRIFVLAYLGYMIVGLGSIAFHATLKYPGQMLDELGMIYTTCLMMHASFSFSRSDVFSAVFGVVLLGTAVSITLYYYITQNPVFHQVAYGVLTATLVFHSIWVMEGKLRPAVEARQGPQGHKLLKSMWIMVGVGLAIFLGGFLIWNLENVFCSEIIYVRRAIGLPWAVLLEGHAWWHLMTGMGAYYCIVWSIWLRHCLSGRETEYTLHWPRLFTSIPEVRRTGGGWVDMKDKKLFVGSE